MIALPMSGILGGTLGGYLLSLDGRSGLAGWQWLFLVEGIPSILFGIACIWYLTDNPSKAHWLTAEQRDWLMKRMEQDVTASRTAHAMPALHALRKPVIWLLGLPYFFMLTAGYAYTFWAPLVIKDSLHTSDTKSALVTAVIALCSMIFMTVMAHSSDIRNERFFHAALGGTLIAIGFTGAALISHPVLKIVFFGLVIVGSNQMLAPFWCLPSLMLSGSSAAVGIALINSLGNTGGFIGPYLIGFLKDATGGTTGSFLVLAFSGIASAVCCLMLRQSVLGAVPKTGGVNTLSSTS
jgi:sugar phosphate permease